jgi:putative oxidoreductase
MRLPIADNPRAAHDVLRFTIALVFLSHAVTRVVTDRVTPFGRAFDAWGWPYGIYWAWGVTLWELIGGTLLLLGVKTRVVPLVFIVQMLFGIALVHWKNGWFVVGHGFNGIEFSVTIIAVLVAISLTAPKHS